MIDPTLGQPAFINQQQAPAGFPFNQYPGVAFAQQQSQHSKSFSLPVSFDPQHQQPNQAQMLPPPERACHLNGDVPLPTGWVSEKAPNGQTYYYKYAALTVNK